MQLLDALKRARAALDSLDAEVRFRGEPLPADGALIVLDMVSSQGRDVDGAKHHTIQVGVYADTHGESLGLCAQAETLLEAAGFRQGQTRPAPGNEPGLVTDWRIG